MEYEERKDSDIENNDRSHLLHPSNNNPQPQVTTSKSRQPLCWIATSLLISFLLASNIIAWVRICTFEKQDKVTPAEPILAMDEITSTFHTYTPYSSNDSTTANAAWATHLSLNGIVALPHSWGQRRGWPKARDMPGDSEKGIYVVDGFHQLHCLMSIRDTVAALLDNGGGGGRTDRLYHLNHCYDVLRQAIICRADDTPLYVPKETLFAGDGQERRCRSWGRLEEWVVGHTACYGGVKC